MKNVPNKRWTLSIVTSEELKRGRESMSVWRSTTGLRRVLRHRTRLGWEHWAIVAVSLIVMLGLGQSSRAADWKKSQEIADRLKKQLVVDSLAGSSDTQQALSKALEDAAYRRRLLGYAFLDTFTTKGVAALADQEPFLAVLTADTEWLEMLLMSGPIGKPEQTLALLAKLWQADHSCATEADLKTLATAIALEFGRRGWPADRALTRYAFYRDSQRAGLLHPMYDNLETWEKRYLAGYDLNRHGEPRSQIWLRDNVKLPAKAYRGACWQVPYRGHNIFGDTVQGPLYYQPFEGCFDSFSQMCRYVGGVCGRLSGYGAGAAVANGVPATTMGEPGHCAYAVRVARDEWMPAYSLSWKRGVHTNFYGGSYGLLILVERIFADKNAVRQASYHRWQGRLLQANQAAAGGAYRLAIAAEPIHYGVWTEYLDWLKGRKDVQPKMWRRVHDAILVSYAEYPEMAWSLVKRYAYPHLLPKLKPDELVSLLGAFHRSILDGWGPHRWNFEGALDWQFRQLDKDETARERFLRGLLACYMESEQLAGPVLVWGFDKFADTPAHRELFFHLLEQQLASHRGSSERIGKPLTQLIDRAILAAEKNDDHEAFQAAAHLASRVGKVKKVKRTVAVRGELLSANGMIRPSSTCRWDTPWKHPFVLSELPGFFHTDKTVNPSVVLELAHFGRLAAIDIVNRPGNLGRAVPLKVDVSEDGKTWATITTLEKPLPRWTLNLTKQNVDARFVRLTKQGTDYLHLLNIRVYGRRRS